MSKNIVFIIAVKKDGQLKPEYEIGIESWRRWCRKNDVELFLLEEPILPMSEMHIIWQRYFLFDIYDANGIESDQTLMVDADTIVHPDTPNFFELTDPEKLYMIHDDGSYDWILRGMEHYAREIKELKKPCLSLLKSRYIAAIKASKTSQRILSSSLAFCKSSNVLPITKYSLRPIIFAKCPNVIRLTKFIFIDDRKPSRWSGYRLYK